MKKEDEAFFVKELSRKEERKGEGCYIIYLHRMNGRVVMKQTDHAHGIKKSALLTCVSKRSYDNRVFDAFPGQ